MKKIITIALALLAISLSTVCSEKNWLVTKINNAKNKIDTITKETVSRHTYKYGSFEHIRDMAILFCLPSNVSQPILKQQRSNMRTFLKENEENALLGVKAYLNIGDKKWSTIMTTLKEDSEFNLKAMQNEGNYNTTHDPSLPKEWITGLEKKCSQRGIHPENVNFGTAVLPGNGFACARSRQPQNNTYSPTEIDLNQIRYNYFLLTEKPLPQEMNHIFDHEIVHALNNHGLARQILYTERDSELLLKLQWRKLELEDEKNSIFTTLNPFSSKKQLANQSDILDRAIDYEKEKRKTTEEYLTAAQEKTADTFFACIDPEAANNAAYAAQHGAGYPENYNDIRVINDNWKITQAITNFQQLKSSIAQKLREFPRFFA